VSFCRGPKVKRTKREDAATTMTTVSSETATSSSSSSAAVVDNATANGFNNKEFPVETNHGANTGSDPRETPNNTEHLGINFQYTVSDATGVVFLAHSSRRMNHHSTNCFNQALEWVAC
jgi:hypothetical protein